MRSPEAGNGTAHRPSRLSWLLLIVPMLWGLGYPLIRSSMDEIGALPFLVYRFGVALVPLLIVLRASLRGLDRAVWCHGILMGVALAAAYGSLNVGLTYTTTVKAGFIIGLRVVLIPMLVAVLLPGSIRARTWMAALLSTAGLAIIFLGTESSWASVNRGDVMMALSALAFAVHVLLIGRLSRPDAVQAQLLIQIGVVTVLGGLLTAAIDGLAVPTSRVAWMHLATTGVLSTALALWLQTRYQLAVPAERAGIIYSSEPLFAAFFGFLYLGERLVGWQWLGALLILAAMLLVQWPAVRRAFSHRAHAFGH